MKRIKLFSTILLFVATLAPFNLKAQSKGTLTFKATLTPHTGRYGSKYVLAVWIQDVKNNFVKTSLRMSAKSSNIRDHLANWKSKSNLNVVDAVTGATLTSYANPITIKWDATDVSGNIVPDGIYSVWIEETWDDGAANTSITSFSFTKNQSSDTLNPASTSNFTNISIIWLPSVSTDIMEVFSAENISIFPNPAREIVYVDFNKLVNIKRIFVNNSVGQVVYSEKIGKALFGSKSLNLKGNKAGIYYINIECVDNNNVLRYKILLK